MPSIPEIVDVAKAVEDSEVIRDVGHAQGVVNEAVPPNETEDKQGTEDDVDEEMPPAESVVPLGADKDSKVFSAAEHPQAVVHVQATAAVQHPQQASMLFQSVEPDGQGKEIVRPDVNAGLPTTEAVIPPPAVNDSGVIAAIEHPQATVHLQDVLSNGEGNEYAKDDVAEPVMEEADSMEAVPREAATANDSIEGTVVHANNAGSEANEDTMNDSGVIAAIEHPQATVHLQDVLSNGEGNESAAIPRVGDKCSYCSEVFKLGAEVLVQETMDYYRFEFCCRKCMVEEDLTIDDGVIRATANDSIEGTVVHANNAGSEANEDTMNDSGVIAAIEHPQASVHLQDVLSNGEGKKDAKDQVAEPGVEEADSMEAVPLEAGPANDNVDGAVVRANNAGSEANEDTMMQDDDSYDFSASGDEEVIVTGVAAAPPSLTSCRSMDRETHLYLLLGSDHVYLNHSVPHGDIFGVAATALLPWFRHDYSSVNGFRRHLAAYVNENLTEMEFRSIVGSPVSVRQNIQAYVCFLHGDLEPSKPDLGQYADINIIVRFLRAHAPKFTGSVWVVNMNRNPPFYGGLTLVDHRTVFPNRKEAEILPGDIVFVNAYANHWRLAESRPQQKYLP